MPFEIKKREDLIMIAAVALDKIPSKIIPFYVLIIVFNIYLVYGFRKIIILVDNSSEENFISPRFVKKNDLISDLMKYKKNSIDRHTVTIYRKHDLITYNKNSENQNQTNIVNFLATNMERYGIILK
jgi:hypothetical protein